MPFDYATGAAAHKVPNLPEAGAHVGFYDVLGSKKMTGSYFLLESDAPSTPPKYEYDESGVLMKGELKLEDVNGRSVQLKAGDVFFIHTGSTITFSTTTFALAYKTSSRAHSKL
ncbi:hypothetical protein LTR10_020440 [Elasticomyces elasticus]|uniref:(S)-ureidoglycine aminohydrolase cupin domain-containing protein n=1 Tax=Exophiala sideris TaxID=1016849 RepID=A0ABR0J426_9EURO|nr:hypothetical protein LTR10_020440 [Elasticomyces elasticus]KAK5027035.1 hypothetical protein LTS07_007334 [Exophiala sideris]KAK5034039.1 hypothetical protein LTR13_006639 [Exophiala sideris]KAK5055685.1 hypothetical protein LTR69_008060 [Exophiala sideris]KAK5180981.1 hypothetical protein LTR44_006801 [Eurotiomycetes sp. CCFEE 6388]